MAFSSRYADYNNCFEKISNTEMDEAAMTKWEAAFIGGAMLAVDGGYTALQGFDVHSGNMARLPALE